MDEIMDTTATSSMAFLPPHLFLFSCADSSGEQRTSRQFYTICQLKRRQQRLTGADTPSKTKTTDVSALKPFTSGGCSFSFIVLKYKKCVRSLLSACHTVLVTDAVDGMFSLLS